MSKPKTMKTASLRVIHGGGLVRLARLRCCSWWTSLKDFTRHIEAGFPDCRVSFRAIDPVASASALTIRKGEIRDWGGERGQEERDRMMW